MWRDKRRLFCGKTGDTSDFTLTVKRMCDWIIFKVKSLKVGVLKVIFGALRV